jgi:hypothetical protein
MLKTLLDSARNALSSDASLIRQSLAALGHLDPALATRAAGYVIDGSEGRVLLDLRPRAPESGTLLGNPGRACWGFHSRHPDSQVTAAVDAGLAARHALYKRIAVKPAELAVLMRLGHVLEAADQGQSLQRAGSSAPDWLQYVLNDSLWASFANNTRPEDDAGMTEARPAWDIRLLRALLEEAGLPQAMALPIVFERRGIDAYFQAKVYRRLLATGALDDDMLARPDDVELAAKALSAAGKVLLANRIGANEALRNRYAGLLVRLAVSDSKTVRAAAARHLDAVERGACHAQLEALLRGGQGDERINAAELLARVQGAGAGPVLEAALAQEPGKAVQQAIRAALSRIQAASEAADIALPAPPPLPEWQDTVLADDAADLLLANREQLLERLRQGAAAEREANDSGKHKYKYQQQHYERYRQLRDNQLRLAVQALNGAPAALEVLHDRNVVETLEFGRRLEARPDFGLLQALRLELHSRKREEWLWFSPLVQGWMRRQDLSRVDLRQMSEAAAHCGASADVFALACLRQTWSSNALPQALLPPERVWPCLAQFPELIDEGLGMAAAERGRYQNLDLGQTLATLDTFPVLPARWLPRVMEFALGETKSQRQAAQRVLGKLPDIGKRVVEALQSSKQELRIEAARWLARMNYRAAVPALYAALDKEARETVSAELMTALERLGEDMAPRLSPDALLQQARKGLKARPPGGLAWLKLDGLPPCAWQDGSVVAPEIIRWWVILAAKLKEPAANALLLRYLGLLDASSRAALGRFVLLQFIAHDTANPSLEEAIAWAGQHASARYQSNQQLAQQYPQYYGEAGKLTPEQVFEQVKREKLSEYLGSAIGEKGILALASGAPGHELADAIRLYMRDHYPRRAQIEAMLEAAAVSDDPAVIQFVLSIARRYRTASVQQKARLLVERIAERNGWTEDQLADRTIPTGGLDESGSMRFQYGAREFSVVLDEKLKPALRNAEGKPVAALPAARQNDPPESIKEGKQLFATCKKEVKQVVDLQGARLYEAMCAGRVWLGADWNEYVRRHPVVGRLAQRLVWTRLDQDGAGDGKVAGLFRPTEDGSLIDAADDEVDLPADARVGLAHASLLDAGTVRAWLAHFKDYKVTPLFPQLTRAAPVLVDPAAEQIGDRLGWTSDTFTLRGAFGKLGYQRGAAEDGGVFMEYTKDFASARLQVRIEFSGSSLPEENMPAALKTLGFVRIGARGFGAGIDGSVALGKVPPVLLAEAYGDYHAVAAACQGFDPDWERKMPW